MAPTVYRACCRKQTRNRVLPLDSVILWRKAAKEMDQEPNWMSKSKLPCLIKTALFLILLFAANGSLAQKREWYSSHECHMRFEIPEGWTARQLPINQSRHYEKTICTVQLQPHNIADLIHKNDEVDVYTIEIAAVANDFDHAAESGGFERRKDGWVVLGRTEIESPVHAIQSSGWKGLEGTATGGCFHEDGRGYAGLCDIPTAVVNDRARMSAIFDGNPQSSDQFEAILKSFRFIP